MPRSTDGFQWKNIEEYIRMQRQADYDGRPYQRAFFRPAMDEAMYGLPPRPEHFNGHTEVTWTAYDGPVAGNCMSTGMQLVAVRGGVEVYAGDKPEHRPMVQQAGHRRAHFIRTTTWATRVQEAAR